MIPNAFCIGSFFFLLNLHLPRQSCVRRVIKCKIVILFRQSQAAHKDIVKKVRDKRLKKTSREINKSIDERKFYCRDSSLSLQLYKQ